MIGSAIGFGTGLGLFLPAFQLLLKSSPADFGRLYLERPGIPDALRSSIQSALNVFPADRFWAFVLLMTLICLAGLVSSLAGFGQEILSNRVIRVAAHSWRRRVFRHMLHLPSGDLLRFGSPDCLSRLIADTEVVAQGYAALLGTTSCDLLRAGAALIVALVLDWRLALLCLFGAVPTGLLMKRLGRSIRSATARLLEHNAEMISTIQEALRGIPVIKVYQAEGVAERRFLSASRRHLEADLRGRRTKALGSPAMEVITLCGVACVACIAAWFVFRRNVEAASVLALLLALSGASQSLRTVSKAVQKIQEADVAAARLFAVLETRLESDRSRALPKLPKHTDSIDFEQVTFFYPGRAFPALEDVNLHIQYGQIVALVGENGAGKSTLINLLPRLFQPQRGRVLIDGRDISEVGLASLRRQIAMVPQQTILFSDSILGNIRFGMRVSRKRVEAAARAACADEFIEPLRRGYDTKLGELGSGLSEGQKQRLAIARALLRAPRVLLLDEPTSQIDPDSESKIHRVLGGLSGAVTVILIAHRSSTIELADMVVRMDKGRISDVALGQGTAAVRALDTTRGETVSHSPALEMVRALER
jgi:subfamily B ATP-binding cassette protein MsbA